MKKSIILVFLIALLLTISACGNSEEESVHNPDVEHMDIEKQEQVESNDQLTKETEASEEEVEGFEEILELEENKSLTQLYKKYSEVLMQILIDRTDSNGRYFDDGSQGVDFSRNCFAVMDIDGDGRDELIFNFNDTYMAAMQEIMYDYDEKTDILQTELESSYVMNTYYSNGYVKVGASHNHTCDPQTRGVWPYSVYQYNPQKDSYSDIGYVQCWDGLIFPTDYDGAVFPGELDTDGDNLLFSVSYYVNGTDEVECTYMNREEFEEWEQTMFPDEYKINIEYHPMTEEEITQLIGIKSQNSVNGSEFALNNTNDGLEEIKNDNYVFFILIWRCNI